MSNFTVRRFILVASMLFCQLALADDTKEPPPPADQPELPFKLLAAIKPVTMEDVDKVVEASDKAVQNCNRKSKRAETLAVMMNMTIDGDGNVTEVEAAPEDDGAKAPPEAVCLAKVAKKLKFPATGTVSHVSYPFMIVGRVKASPAL
jgi:hypothetical protein